MDRVIMFIDSLCEKIGKAVAWLVVPLTLGLVYEVAARYFFRAPTVWAFDLSYMLCGTLFMLGASYTLHTGAHVRVDVFHKMLSKRNQAIVDAVLYIVFFFPALFFLMIKGFDWFWYAWQIGERATASPWRPIIYPFKAVIPLASFLLILQGIAEFLTCVQIIKRRKGA